MESKMEVEELAIHYHVWYGTIRYGRLNVRSKADEMASLI